MAGTAKEDAHPDLAAMSVEDRSLYLLPLLRQAKGEVEVDEAGRWLRVAANSFVAAVHLVAPWAAEGLLATVRNWLRDNKLAAFEHIGGGTYAIYIKLEDGADTVNTSAAPPEDPDDTQQIQRDVATVAAAAAKLAKLQAENARLTTEVKRLNGLLAEQRQLGAAQLAEFRAELAKLEQALQD